MRKPRPKRGETLTKVDEKGHREREKGAWDKVGSWGGGRQGSEEVPCWEPPVRGVAGACIWVNRGKAMAKCQA